METVVAVDNVDEKRKSPNFTKASTGQAGLAILMTMSEELNERLILSTVYAHYYDFRR